MDAEGDRTDGRRGARFWRWARLLAAAGILALLGARLGHGPFLDALSVLSARSVAAGLAIGVITTVLSAWRWTLVARGLGLHLSLPAAVGDYYRALFLNAVLPGGVLGDVHRAVRHGRDSLNLALSAKAVVLERTAGQVVLVAAAAAVLLANPAALPLTRVTGPAVTPLTAALTAGVLAATVLVLRVWVRRGRSRWAGALATWAGEVRRGLGSWGTRAAILGASAAVLAGHLATFVVAARAAGATVPVLQLAPLMLVALLAMGVPLSIGGWGPREAATASAFAAAGLGASQGLTVAVAYGLLAAVASLPGAVMLALTSRTPGGRRRSAAVRRPRSAGPRPAPRVELGLAGTVRRR